MKVGDTVLLCGSHPFAGHKGEIVAIQEVMGLPRPRVRIFDMQDHEVFVMRQGDLAVLRPSKSGKRKSRPASSPEDK